MLNLEIKYILHMNGIELEEAQSIDLHFNGFKNESLLDMINDSYGRSVLTCIICNFVMRKERHSKAFDALFPTLARAYLLSIEQEGFFDDAKKYHAASTPNITVEDAHKNALLEFASIFIQDREAVDEITKLYDSIMQVPIETNIKEYSLTKSSTGKWKGGLCTMTTSRTSIFSSKEELDNAFEEKKAKYHATENKERERKMALKGGLANFFKVANGKCRHEKEIEIQYSSVENAHTPTKTL